MANRNPLVIISGVVQELPTQDVLVGITRYIQVIAVPTATAITNVSNVIGTIECPISGSITSLRAKTTSGSCTVDFKRNGVSMGTVNATSAGVDNNSPTNNTVTAFDDITFDVTNASGSGLVLMLTVRG